MMERYRAELLRYQRATPPGKPTLAQNFEASERGRTTTTVTTDHSAPAQPDKEVQVRAARPKAESVSAAQSAGENKRTTAQSELRRERVIVDTPPIMMPALTPRLDTVIQNEEEVIIPPQAPIEETAFLEPPSFGAPPIDVALDASPAPAAPQPPINVALDASPIPAAPQPPINVALDASPVPAAPQPPINVALDASSTPATPQSPVNTALDPAMARFTQPPVSTQRQAPPLNAGVAPGGAPLSPQQIAEVPKLAGAPIPKSVLDSIAQPTLQNAFGLPLPIPQSVVSPQPSNDGSTTPTPQSLTLPPQAVTNSITTPMPQSVMPLAQPVFGSMATPIPQSLPPPTAPTAPNVPMLSIPNIQPEQAPAPARSERAIAPVETSEPGCIAHTEFEKAIGAYGVFRPYERMGKYTLASFLQTPGEAVQTLVRFAADVPPGSADAIRCRRSFTVKFFCREGEYDLFGMHLPVSVGTTEKTLSDCCAASRANPKTGLRTRSAFWEFLVTHREALHAALWLYSDLGTIGSYRTIDGYGLPCLWVNAKNERRAVRPRWLSRQRPQTLTRFEAEELAGSDPDAVARDLVQNLQSGDRPQYELSIQVIEPEQFATLPFNPFDPTAIWPTEQFKPQRIGLLTLERLPDDILTELDSTRFGPENSIPGIEHVPAPAIKSGDDFTQVRQYLRSLGEFSRHRLIDNLREELLRMPPLLLEQVLILFSQADLEFGQAMTLTLGG